MHVAITASVVIPSRGGARRLQTLLGLLNQQSVASLEAVVVLDGDIDGSEDAVLAMEPTLDFPVQTIVFAENRGRAAALNAGFDAARGDILIRCDDDHEPGVDYVRHHVRGHAGADVGVAGLPINTFPENAYSKAYGHDADANFRATAYATPASQTWRYWGGNVSVTREAYDEVGPYDLGYRAYGFEDVDWGYRLHETGRDVLILPELETLHRLSAITAESRALRAFFSGAAKKRFDLLHPGALTDHQPGGLWGGAVVGAARVLNEARVARTGRAVDRTLRYLPGPVAPKAVALLVEASGIAGTRAGRVSSVTAI